MKTPNQEVAPKAGARLFSSGSFVIQAARLRPGSGNPATDPVIWVRPSWGAAPVPVLQSQLPYTLAPNNVILCYNPERLTKGERLWEEPAEDPDVEYFCVDYVDAVDETESVEEVIEYENTATEDSLEVDFSVLDQFEEFYDPEGEGDAPYICTDEGQDSIGIEG